MYSFFIFEESRLVVATLLVYMYSARRLLRICSAVSIFVVQVHPKRDRLILCTYFQNRSSSALSQFQFCFHAFNSNGIQFTSDYLSRFRRLFFMLIEFSYIPSRRRPLLNEIC